MLNILSHHHWGIAANKDLLILWWTFCHLPCILHDYSPLLLCHLKALIKAATKKVDFSTEWRSQKCQCGSLKRLIAYTPFFFFLAFLLLFFRIVLVSLTCDLVSLALINPVARSSRQTLLVKLFQTGFTSPTAPNCRVGKTSRNLKTWMVFFGAYVTLTNAHILW